jgi:hypothetical protein
MKATTMVPVCMLLMSLSPGLALAVDQSQEYQTRQMDSGAAAGQEAPTMSGGGMPMQEQMQKMRSQMDEIHRTKDPDKRNELIQAHMESMQEMMKMMQGMHGGQSMMGPGGMPGGNMTGGRPGGMPESGMGMQGGKMTEGLQGESMATPRGAMPGGMMDMMNRQQMMEQRMGMMQMMMDQMIQNQAAMEDTRQIRLRHDHCQTK